MKHHSLPVGDNGPSRSVHNPYESPCGRDHLVERGIRAVFRSERAWLGIYQVKCRLVLPEVSWVRFQLTWLRLVERGELIVSFDAQHDQFSRYLYLEVMQ